jgi:hypothetical protein
MMAATIDPSHCDPLTGVPAVDSASITPPQSANGKTTVPEGVPSEEEAEDIEPDHYYGGGKIPVFKPVSGRHVSHTKSGSYCIS